MGFGISGFSVPNIRSMLSHLATGMSESIRRLSSGTRVNSAKDDAAAVSISTRLQAQIRGNVTAVRNVNDVVSMVQTGEAITGVMTDNLLRIRDLALQAAND